MKCMRTFNFREYLNAHLIDSTCTITNAEQRNDLRQSRLDRQRECNKEQLNRQMQGKLGLLKVGRLTDKEGKLKDSLSLSKPMCPP